MGVTCDRCGATGPVQSEATAPGWSRFETLREDGETIDYVTVRPDCLTDPEDRRGVWPSPSPVTHEAEERRW